MHITLGGNTRNSNLRTEKSILYLTFLTLATRVTRVMQGMQGVIPHSCVQQRTICSFCGALTLDAADRIALPVVFGRCVPEAPTAFQPF